MNWANFFCNPVPYFKKILIEIGVDFYLDKNDRRILEGKVLPWVAGSEKFEKILWVGCEWYTRGYRKFFKNKEYWTLEMNPALRKYGSGLHVTDKLQYSPRHFLSGYFDAIFCYGLIGYGINDQLALVQAMQACNQLLRPDGLLVLGWDNDTDRLAVDVDDALPLDRWSPFELPPVGSAILITPHQGQHTFRFFLRR